MLRAAAALLLLLGRCRSVPSAPRAAGAGVESHGTTASEIALGNLEASIDHLEACLARGELSPGWWGGLVELLLARAQFLGRISDLERATEHAERLAREAPAAGESHLALARAKAALHLFGEAEARLHRAARLGAPAEQVAALRATLLQATGRYEDALAIRRRLSDRRDVSAFGAEAALLAETGDLAAAERRFRDARTAYRDVSPFPLAWLEFQEGRMWMRAGRLEEARRLFGAAHARLPEYTAATGHLGEVEAALGRTEQAVALLRQAAAASEDPDPAGQLARVLHEAGRLEEAELWRQRAAAGYQALLARHPEALADHAAEFWLGAGRDPRRALALARLNLRARQTPEAYALAARAAKALRRPGPLVGNDSHAAAQAPSG